MAGMLELYRAWKREGRDKTPREEVIEKEDLVAALPDLNDVTDKRRFRQGSSRYRRFEYLAPVAVHEVCQRCHAPCCRLEYIHAAITMAEWPKVCRPVTQRPWRLNVHYPRRALDDRPLEDVLNGRRYVSVKSIRWRSGRPEHDHVEVYIAKKADGSCIHQRPDGRCSIYAQRPHACKAWFCGRGTENDAMWRELCEREEEERREQ